MVVSLKVIELVATTSRLLVGLGVLCITAELDRVGVATLDMARQRGR